MIRTLQLATWQKGFIAYKDEERTKRFAVLFVPETRRKIALIVHAGQRKSFLWYDRTRGLWRRTDNVYTLRRMLRHMLDGYDAIEMPKLAMLLTELRKFDPKIVVLPTMPKAAVEQLREAIGNAVMELDLAQSFWKEEARDQLEFVLILRDSNGRLNIAVLRTRNTIAREYLERRMEEVLGIKAWVAHYLGIVERLVWGLEYLLREAMRALDVIVWKKTLITRGQINHAIHDAQQLALPPFRFTSHAVSEELKEAASFALGGNEKHARQFVRRAWEGLAMKSVRARLERMLLDDTFTLYDLIATHNALSSRRITEKGFRYLGKRKKAQNALSAAIRVLRDNKNRDEARKQVKEAASHL